MIHRRTAAANGRRVILVAAPPPVIQASEVAIPASPEAYLRSLYAGYRAGARGDAWLEPDQVFAGPILALIRTYRSRAEPGMLDGDPFCGCQDWSDIRVDSVATHVRSQRAVDATVTFRDLDDVRKQVRFRLVRARATWRVADMTLTGFDGEPWLSSVLREENGSTAADVAGRYGPLLIAVRGDEVHGAFSEQRIGNGTDEAPQFTCRFTFAGRLREGAADIASRSPDGEAIPGRLEVMANIVHLRLRANHAGCAMTSGSMTTAPFTASRNDAGGDWNDVGLTVARVARLRSAPHPEPAAGRPYLVEGDAVAVLTRKGEWLRVRYDPGQDPRQGWLRADEVMLP